MYNGQFLLEYKDFFKANMPKDDVEGRLYKLLQIYDDNYVMAMLSNERFNEKIKVFKSEKNSNSSFRNAVNVLYDMNMYIRMLATLDDILVKISVYTYGLYQNIDIKELPSIEKGSIKNFRNYFTRNKLINFNYPQLPDTLNRETRKYRNDITHGGELMLNKGMVKDSGLTLFYGPNGTHIQNEKIFETTKKELEKDLIAIDKVQNNLEIKILACTDLIKLKHD